MKKRYLPPTVCILEAGVCSIIAASVKIVEDEDADPTLPALVGRKVYFDEEEDEEYEKYDIIGKLW